MVVDEFARPLTETRSSAACGCFFTMSDDLMRAKKSRVNSQSIRSLELFTGAGGLALGTHFAGFDHPRSSNGTRTLAEHFAKTPPLAFYAAWRRGT